MIEILSVLILSILPLGLPLVDKNLPHKPDNKSSKGKTTDNLAFICGQTNPLLFVSEFEKCSDVKTDKDKMFKLRKFVNDSHRGTLTEQYIEYNLHGCN